MMFPYVVDIAPGIVAIINSLRPNNAYMQQ